MQVLSDEFILRTSYRSPVGRVSLSISRSQAFSKVPWQRRREVLVAGLFGAVTFAISAAWCIARIPGSKLGATQILTISSALAWMILAPTLMTLGQSWVELLLREVQCDAADENLDRSEIKKLEDAKVRLTLIDRFAVPIPMIFSLVFGLSFLLASNAISKYLVVELTGLDLVLGVGLFSVVGFTSGEGVWGVLKTVVLERELTAINWPWYPFEPWQIGTLTKLGRYSYTTALIFSTGALFLPLTTSLYAASIDLVTRTAAAIAVFVLTGGSAVLFVYPYLRLQKLQRRQRESALRRIGEQLDFLLPRKLHRSKDEGAPTASDNAELLLNLWNQLKMEPVSPIHSLATFVGQLTTTLIVPFSIALLTAFTVGSTP